MPLRRQGRVNVSHADLRGQDASVVTHILPGGLRYLSRSQPAGEVHLDRVALAVAGPREEGNADRSAEAEHDRIGLNRNTGRFNHYADVGIDASRPTLGDSGSAGARGEQMEV